MARCYSRPRDPGPPWSGRVRGTVNETMRPDPESGALMFKRKRLLKWTIILLYAVTWIGGWISHARQLKAETEAHYRAAAGRFQADEARARKGGWEVPSFARVNEHGPTSFFWCMPLLPGV